MYYNMFTSMRQIFDTMIGPFYDGVHPDRNNLFILSVVIIVMVNKRVLANFIVAILEATYRRMETQGNFSFQCNQYQFIERYSVAFMNEWGYSELVIHPAPINVFTMIMAPAVFREGTMK